MITKRRSDLVRRIRNTVFRIRKRSGLVILRNHLFGHEGALPSFLVAGGQRCGTTTLHHNLASNPALSPSYVKEVHYFDLKYQRGLAWYRGFFPKPKADEPIITFESTPCLFHPHAARRVHETVPNAKLIILLRNPIDRAFSHYGLSVRIGVEKRSFEEAIDAEIINLPDEIKRVQADDKYVSKLMAWYTYLMRGFYVDQLKVWEQYFPREQFLIMRSEDYFSDPPSVLRQVADFVGFPYHEPETLSLSKGANRLSMKPATRERLVEYYRDTNARLYEYLGRDMGWDR